MPGANQQGSEATAAWFDDANESSLQQPGWTMVQQIQATANSSSRSSSSSSSSANSSSDSSGSGSSSSSSSRDQKNRLDTISFSHFLPHQHLLPEKRMLTYPNLVSS
jgi:hypothetical protein